MANDLIVEEHNNNIDSEDYKQHEPNPQEESFEDSSNCSLPQNEKSLGEKHSVASWQEESLKDPSGSFVQLQHSMSSPLHRAQSMRKKERKERKKSSTTNVLGDGKQKNGRWSVMEHVRFLEALKMYGKNWKKVEEHVATRTST